MNKFTVGFLSILAFFVLPLSAHANNSGLAIVLIDMQLGFYQRGGVENAYGLKRLVANQRTLLNWAVKNEIPVLVFEYQDFKETDPRLMKIIATDSYKIVTKVNDNGFTVNSQSRATA